MTVLALDASSRREIVCILATEDGRLVDPVTGPGDAVARVVPPALAGLLRAGPAALVVVLGPGSYTGVRAGIAAIVGVATATGLPVHGVSSLEVVAAAAPEAATVLAPAGRGAVYAAPCVAGSPGPARRLDSAATSNLPSPCAACEPLPLPDLIVVERSSALAAAVPRALQRPSLELAGVQALLVS